MLGQGDELDPIQPGWEDDCLLYLTKQPPRGRVNNDLHRSSFRNARFPSERGDP